MLLPYSASPLTEELEGTGPLSFARLLKETISSSFPNAPLSSESVFLEGNNSGKCDLRYTISKSDYL